MQKKDRGWRGYDVWTPFGGHIEEGEDPITCIVREVREELELSIDAKNLEFFSEIATKTKNGQAVPLYVYACYLFAHISEVRVHEGCGFAFWYIDELPLLPMQPHEKQIAERIIQFIKK